MFSESVARRGVGSAYDSFIAAATGGPGPLWALVKGLISRESAWNPQARNPADPSYGLLQITPRTANIYQAVTPDGLMDPETNIRIGTRYLSDLLYQYAVPDAVSAYNAGRPIAANRGYVDDVLAYAAWYQANDPAFAGAPAPAPDGAPADTGSFLDGIPVWGYVAAGLAALVLLRRE